VGGVLSLALFATIRGWERRDLEKRAADLTHEQAEKLQVTVLRSMEVLHSIAALHTLHGGMTPGQFQQFVQPTLARQPELQALSWNPVVPAAERNTVETAARAEGLSQFQFCEKNRAGHLIPARARDLYIPVRFIEPLERNRAALGYDLASDECRRLSLEQARDSGKPVATAPIQLAQGPDNQAGFLVLLPVYHSDLPPTTIAERQRHLKGFAVAVFRVNDLVAQFFHELKAKGIEAALYDQSRNGPLLYAETPLTPALSPSEGERVAARPRAGNSAPPNIVNPLPTSAVIHLEIAGRKWALAFQALPEFAASASHYQSWLVLCGALAFTLLATAYLYGGWRRTMEIAAVNAALQEEVTVRQRAEAAADKANQAKSDFLASMSHEIRTPLNAILGYTQLMQRDPQLPIEQRDAVGGISASGQHLLGLINEILDLSKIEAGRMELQPVNFDLAMLGNGLAATFRPLCAQKKIRFRLEVGGARPGFSRSVPVSGAARRESPQPPDFAAAFSNLLVAAPGDGRAPVVRGDEGKLRQVLINLVGNAVKFTNVGEVCLRIQPTANERWRFEVVDTGLGIPDEERDDIFKPFHQGSGAQHQGGTGLGLAIARRQVELLGGKLELESERGIGSCFYFELPLVPATDAVEKVSSRVVRLAPGHTVRALVVDDNRENRDVLGRMLTAVGCEVLFAANGDEALQYFRADGAPASGAPEPGQPAIVFLHLLLPGASGVETARNIVAEAKGRAPKIVAHTASALPRHREEARAAGCVDFIAKPFEAEKLYECLERHLGVAFERETVDEPQTSAIIAAESVCLPEELSARLMVAAELHSTTALKSCLQELRGGSPEAERLAEEIRQLMRSYDMDSIQRLLMRVTAQPVNG
jgi:signal transduction histidine kinase/CheY-like chemotaxis protein